MSQTRIHLRLAVPEDVPILRELIEASVRGLQAQDYTQAQIEGALTTVFGVDSQLIADGTYFVAETRPGATQRPETMKSQTGLMIIGCGGCSKRNTLYGRDHLDGRRRRLLPPHHRAHKLRALFLLPLRAA